MMHHDGIIMSRPVSKLVDLDIDEVSVVDRGANQHSLIAFSKSLHTGGADDPEGPMPDDVLVFDEAGEEVAVEELEHGDTVFDEDGNEYVFVEDEADELAEVGKGIGNSARAFQSGLAGISGMQSGTAGAQRAYGAGARTRSAGVAARKRVSDGSRSAGRRARTASRDFFTSPKPAPAGSPENVKGNFPYAPTANGRSPRYGRIAATGGGGLTLAGAGGYGVYRHETAKSLGDSVIEELSKAVTDSDRDEIIAKAMDEIEIAKAEAAQAMAWAEAEHDARVTDAFISKAAEYNLPVAPAVLGPILKAVAEVLDEEQLDILDAIFEAVGDALYDEIGYVGESSNSSVLDQVNTYADEYVGKSDFSREQMTTAMFEANPAAYDAYLAEMGR